MSDAPAKATEAKGIPSPLPIEAGGAFTVEIAADEAAISAHLRAWEQLSIAPLEQNLFLEPWIALPAWRAFGQRRGARFAFVYEPLRPHLGNRRLLAAIVPLEEGRIGGLPGKVLQLWRSSFAYLATPLLHPDLGAEAFSAFCTWVERETRGLWRLPMISGDGPAFRLLVDEMNRRGWSYFVDDAYTRALLRRAESGEAYLARALDGKRRKNLRRLRERLNELGAVTLDSLDAAEPADPWIEEFLALEAAGWKGRQASALLSRSTDAEYLREIAREAHARGRLEMLALRLGGKAIAMKLNLWGPPSAEDRAAYAFRIAFDETHARYSPGMMLELENVLRFHARPEAAWMDSCASRERFIVDHFWRDRRLIETLIVAPAGHGELLLRCLPLLRWINRKLRPRRGSAPREESPHA